MKLEIETKVKHFHPQLEKLARVLSVKESATRQQVADLARFTYNYGPMIGGHHVAIHDIDRWGNPYGPRLAIVTSDTADWQ